MKNFLFLIISAVMLYSFGCGTSNIGRLHKFIETNASLNSISGYLKIYTLRTEEKSGFADEPASVFYKGYTIYTENGEYVQDVKKSFEKPAVVRLDEGDYIVIAELHKNIISSFHVKIERGKMIEIDKDMLQNPIASN